MPYGAATLTLCSNDDLLVGMKAKNRANIRYRKMFGVTNSTEGRRKSI